MPQRDYDSTVARIAGNILSGRRNTVGRMVTLEDEDAVEWAVRLARKVVVEVKKTEPRGGTD